MVLGTFANFDALDRIEEQQANVVMEPIHAQPKIVLANPVAMEKLFTPEPEGNKLNPVVNDDGNGRVNISGRKHLKPLPLKQEQPKKALLPVESPQIREINIASKVNADPPLPKNVQEKLIAAAEEPMANPSKGAIVEEEKQKPKVIDEEKPKEAEPKTESAKPLAMQADGGSKAKPESILNKEAIQKEDQEIAIEEKESAKEILNKVKNVIEKQNNETKKLFLEKMDKISEKMQKIEKMQEEEAKRDAAESAMEKTKDQVKNLIENVPIAQLLTDQKARMTRNEDNQFANRSARNNEIKEVNEKINENVDPTA